ncbi:Syntaxin [Parasponia andersonii]|uniref:Syntaxin n=1 Tax=Parasponia andersonii TaxID=3476 RepID=A0A2P5AG13_PARAD|nr:Syntaxin [Parasponia andersonii]
MSFQDVAKHNASTSTSSTSSPSHAVAAGIFQINTSVAAFRRLVDAVGTAKDTPDHRRKLHNTRQRILQLVKDTSAKLKSLTESDRDSTVETSKKIEDAKLARDFQTALQEFQKVQRLASHRESSFTPSPSLRQTRLLLLLRSIFSGPLPPPTFSHGAAPQEVKQKATPSFYLNFLPHLQIFIN